MIYRKRTQKDVTDSKIIEIWNECLVEAKRLYPRYFENCTPELYMDNSRSHLGRCSYSVINPYERSVDKIRYSRCIITVSSNLKQDYEQIRKTICHELGHFVTPKEHHSYLWKVRSDKIGEKWGYKATVRADSETFHKAILEAPKRTTFKYMVYCPCCFANWKYKSLCGIVREPQRYQCGKCKVKLQSKKIILEDK
jgi:predicted SprT family Zn-dependent metalloprotease